MSAFENYQTVAAQVAQCALDCGRNPQDVTLIAVSKTVDTETVRQAMAAGAHHFGENRPESLAAKADALEDQTWHFIGNIQSRQIPRIVQHAALIHSLYQPRHAEKINQAAAAAGKVQQVLVEVNVSGEESKSGCAPDQAAHLVRLCTTLPNVCVRGLMTMAPRGNTEAVRATFAGLAALRTDIASSLDAQSASQFNELSMGMSEDWREAIAAGATMVRIGRAIFSDTFEG
ncbi:MAG: YggS family pyridoxal phosphate-dependent enzyme [Coriobacteriia bacterium]|nr:YggS family pyridoxal phosphate-dependent enzyme [Coriobacteriia bacterium]